MLEPMNGELRLKTYIARLVNAEAFVRLRIIHHSLALLVPNLRIVVHARLDARGQAASLDGVERAVARKLVHVSKDT
jgi:hypothetical protein